MSQHCRPAQRQRAAHLTAVLEADPRVVEATIVPAAEDPTDRFLVDVLLAERVDGFPTDLADELAFGVTVRDVRPQGEFWIAQLLA